MSKHLIRGFVATCAALLLLLSFTGAKTFAATGPMKSLPSSVKPANLPCSKQFEEGAYGYQKMDVPGGWADVYDYFHQIGCVTAFDHYQLDGYAGTNVNNTDANVTLSTAISFSGVDVSFVLPAGANFTLESGPTAVHTMTEHDAANYTYSNLNASIFSCFGISQIDTINVTKGTTDNQTAAEVDLGCS
jgi:hypothetical protein